MKYRYFFRNHFVRWFFQKSIEIAFILFLLWPSFTHAAGYMFVYSDGACPTGTSDTGSVHHETQTKKYDDFKFQIPGTNITENSSNICGAFVTEECPTLVIGKGKNCSAVTSSTAVNYLDTLLVSCTIERIKYDTYRICKWDLP